MRISTVLNFIWCLKLIDCQPLKIVQSNRDDGSIEFSKNSLEKILRNDNVKDRFLVAVSITGGFREGKSFLMNFLLQYLRVTYSQELEGDWLNTIEDPFRGFALRTGPEEKSTKLLMWPELFLTQIEDEKVAIVLFDTEGGFDPKIFALTSLISSLQIHNLMRNLRQDYIARSQFLKGLVSEKAPFQNLLLLVRDWPWPYEKPFGLEGGMSLLQEALKSDSEETPLELRQQRQILKSLFQNITCFLMPHPGQVVAGSRVFKGNFKNVEEDFLKNVKVLAPLILSKENLIVKEINGEKIKTGSLSFYLEKFVDALRGSESVDIEKIFLATQNGAKTNDVNPNEKFVSFMEHLGSEVKKIYNSFNLEDDYVLKNDLIKNHFDAKEKALEEFDRLVENYRKTLDQELDEEFLKSNDLHRVYLDNFDAEIMKTWAREVGTLVIFGIVFLIIILTYKQNVLVYFNKLKQVVASKRNKRDEDNVNYEINKEQ